MQQERLMDQQLWTIALGEWVDGWVQAAIPSGR